MYKSDSLCATLLCLLVVAHRATLVERPEANLRVYLERPMLAVRCDRVVHLLDLRNDANARWLSPRPVSCKLVAFASRGPNSLRAALSQALEPLSSPMGMSIPTQARSVGRLRRTSARLTTSTEAASEGTSTAKRTHPARHPSTPATNMRGTLQEKRILRLGDLHASRG
jgi:hypothetical protein